MSCHPFIRLASAAESDSLPKSLLIQSQELIDRGYLHGAAATLRIAITVWVRSTGRKSVYWHGGNEQSAFWAQCAFLVAHSLIQPRQRNRLLAIRDYCCRIIHGEIQGDVERLRWCVTEAASILGEQL